VDRLRHAGRALPLPPAHLRIYYYGTLDPAVFERACEGARVEVLSHGFRSGHRALDIGSGLGTLALGLGKRPEGSYEGIEIHAEAAEWCARELSPRLPGVRFHRADVASRAYNPSGRVTAANYRFPFPNASFDFIYLGSVFTHLMPDEVANYLREISRLLAPGGRCAASYFLLNGDSRAGVDAGSSFMSFRVPHPSGVCLLHDAAVPEAAVAFDEGFVRRIHEEAGLEIQSVRRGAWSSGRSHDQDVLCVGRMK
jgi:SAM-dependent methyltransferase